MRRLPKRLTILFFFLNITTFGQEITPITNSDLDRVFSIKTSRDEGSCFQIIDSTRRSWLVTAKHLIPLGLKSGDFVSFKIKVLTEFVDYEGRVFFLNDPECDIAIIYLPKRLVQEPFSVAQKNAPLTKDIYMLGYPRDIEKKEIGTNLGNVLFPVVLKGSFSAVIPKKFFEVLLINVSNIHGMSGGPALHYDKESKSLLLFGVITAFITTANPVFPVNSNPSIDPPIGYSLSNSGLAVIHNLSFKTVIAAIYKEHFNNIPPPFK